VGYYERVRSPYGGEGGLVALPVFKTVRGAVMPSRVGSIPTRSRHAFRHSPEMLPRPLTPPALLSYDSSHLNARKVSGKGSAGGSLEGIPTRLRALRRQQKRTLKDVAERSGFTESLLSKIESGKTTPPLATLARIAAALGVGLGDLLDDERRTATTVTAASEVAARPATRTGKGYGFHVLAANRAEKIMQPFLFVAERGEVRPGALSHSGEEFIYVLEGEMRYRVGVVTYTLGPGDSLYFDAEEEHDLEPLTPEVRYLGVFTERPEPRPHSAATPEKEGEQTE